MLPLLGDALHNKNPQQFKVSGDWLKNGGKSTTAPL